MLTFVLDYICGTGVAKDSGTGVAKDNHHGAGGRKCDSGYAAQMPPINNVMKLSV